MKGEVPCFLRDSYGVVHEYYISVGSAVCGRRPGWTVADLVKDEGATCLACLGVRPYLTLGDVMRAKLGRKAQPR